MKKTICLAATLVLILLLFSACSKSAAPATETPTTAPVTTEAPTVSEASESQATTESTLSDPDKTGIPVIDSFNTFIAVKADIFGKMQEAISTDPNSLPLLMGLLEPAVMDLEMIPVTFLQSPDAATILGHKSCVIDGDDRDFRIKIVNSADENMLSEGKYDPSKDHLSYSLSLNNAPTSQVDYAQDQNGTYVCQYYVYSTQHIIRMVFNKQDFAIGITTDAVPPASYSDSIPDFDFDYARNDVFYLLYQDGKIVESISKQ